MRKLPNGGIECCNSVCIGQVGNISVRSIGLGGQWFDVFEDEFTPIHGTTDLAEAWGYLCAVTLVKLKYHMGDGETRFPKGERGTLVSSDGERCRVYFPLIGKELECYLNEVERI